MRFFVVEFGESWQLYIVMMSDVGKDTDTKAWTKSTMILRVLLCLPAWARRKLDVRGQHLGAHASHKQA